LQSLKGCVEDTMTSSIKIVERLLNRPLCQGERRYCGNDLYFIAFLERMRRIVWRDCGIIFRIR